MQSIRRLAQIASLVAVAFTASACGKITIPAFMNMDPNATNEISVNAFGQNLTIPLLGGLGAKVTVDTRTLLSPSGILTTIKADSLEIAGPSVTFLGLNTGTLCARENAADPTTATAHVKLFGQSLADFHFSAQATSALIDQLLQGGTLDFAANVDDLPLQIDFAKLLRLDLSGLRAEAVLAGTLPADVPVLGGAPYTFSVSMIGSLKAVSDPLLTECRPFFDAN
jgi:hypothetical protein